MSISERNENQFYHLRLPSLHVTIFITHFIKKAICKSSKFIHNSIEAT